MTSHTPDDGFHEIQLNGKQLVFLFMSATVVSVVIFLCGVLVGRGVRGERAAESAALADLPLADHTTATAGAAPAGSDPRVAAPPAAIDDLTYFNRLEKADAPLDDLKPAGPQRIAAAEPPPPAPRQAPTPAAAAAPPPRTTTAGSSPVAGRRQPQAPAQAQATPPARAPAAGSGFVVQIAALNSLGEADAMVKRLKARGYEAYVQPPADGAPSIFRVRVGSYPTRRDAESVAAKLEKEGQFKPWVAPR